MASVIAEKLSRGIAWVCAAILYLTFGAIFFILCSDVILRYFSGSSLRWASEIPELLFPWLVMAGVVLAAQHGAHIATTFICRRRPRTHATILSLGRPCRDHRRLRPAGGRHGSRRFRSWPMSGPRSLAFPVRSLTSACSSALSSSRWFIWASC